GPRALPPFPYTPLFRSCRGPSVWAAPAGPGAWHDLTVWRRGQPRRSARHTLPEVLPGVAAELAFSPQSQGLAVAGAKRLTFLSGDRKSTRPNSSHDQTP